MKFRKDFDYMMNATEKDYCCKDLYKCGWIELSWEKKIVLCTDNGDGGYTGYGYESENGVKFCPFCGEKIDY